MGFPHTSAMCVKGSCTEPVQGPGKASSIGGCALACLSRTTLPFKGRIANISIVLLNISRNRLKEEDGAKQTTVPRHFSSRRPSAKVCGHCCPVHARLRLERERARAKERARGGAHREGKRGHERAREREREKFQLA